MSFKIIHDSAGCIGCMACAAVSPKCFRMLEAIGKSELIDGTALADGKSEKIVDEKAVEDYENAADVCPVSVIHVQKL